MMKLPFFEFFNLNLRLQISLLCFIVILMFKKYSNSDWKRVDGSWEDKELFQKD